MVSREAGTDSGGGVGSRVTMLEALPGGALSNHSHSQWQRLCPGTGPKESSDVPRKRAVKATLAASWGTVTRATQGPGFSVGGSWAPSMHAKNKAQPPQGTDMCSNKCVGTARAALLTMATGGKQPKHPPGNEKKPIHLCSANASTSSEIRTHARMWLNLKDVCVS